MLAKATNLIRDEEERAEWAASKYTKPMPQGMVEICNRWASELHAGLDTAIPLSKKGMPEPWYWLPGHEPEEESISEIETEYSEEEEEMPANWAPS